MRYRAAGILTEQPHHLWCPGFYPTVDIHTVAFCPPYAGARVAALEESLAAAQKSLAGAQQRATQAAASARKQVWCAWSDGCECVSLAWQWRLTAFGLLPSLW